MSGDRIRLPVLGLGDSRITTPVATLARAWPGVLGVALWGLHLAAGYVGVRLICVHGTGDWWGISAQRAWVFVTTVVIALAVAALVVVSLLGRSRGRHLEDENVRDAVGFVYGISALVNVVMFYAVLLEGVGLFFLEGCG